MEGLKYLNSKEELQQLAKIYRELADIMEEMINLDDEKEVSDEQIQNIIGRFMLKMIEINKIDGKL